jgi:hypothetical protein
MLRCAHIDMKGGKQTFAAPANQIRQLEESGRSGLRTSFSMCEQSQWRQ